MYLENFFGKSDWTGMTGPDTAGKILCDEIRGSVYLEPAQIYGSPKKPLEEFGDAEALAKRLYESFLSVLENFLPADSGYVPVFEMTDEWVGRTMATLGIREFFAKCERPHDGEEIASAGMMSNTGAGLILQIELQEINLELVKYLAKHPEQMRGLQPRKFEELVAELFKDQGYEVEVTPRSKDGGLDIRLIQKSNVGRFLIFVECKRFAEHNRVGVEIVRGLYGVINMHNATSGLIATTSYFTKGAKSEQRTIQHRLALADFEEMKKWLTAYRKGH